MHPYPLTCTYLVLVYQRHKAVPLVVRVQSTGLPLPAAVHAVGAQKVVQACHKGPRAFAEVDGVQLELRLGHNVFEGPQDLVKLCPPLKINNMHLVIRYKA